MNVSSLGPILNRLKRRMKAEETKIILKSDKLMP